MARPHPALFALAAGRSLPPFADASELVRSAREHRMHGLLRSATDEVVDLPPDEQAALDEHDARASEWHSRLWHTLDDAVVRLRAIGVDVMTLKGVCAERRWYDRVGERPCRDVDLLLAPAHLSRVRDVINELEPGHPLAPIAADWIDRGVLDAATLTVDGVHIDLHFDALKIGVPCRQLSTLWDRGVATPLPSGGSVRMLDPELSLLLFLLHQTKDRFRYLLGFVDVLRVIERDAIDWDFLVRFADREGLIGPAAWALDTVGTTLQVSVPHLAPSRGLGGRIWSVVWRPSIRLRGEEGRRRYRKRQELLPLLAPGRRREGIVHAWRVLLPPRALYEAANPGERGGYVRRLALTRPVRYVRRIRSGS